MIYKEEWWAERVYYKDIKIDLHDLENKCKELSKTDEGRKISNIGGWQSNDIRDDTHPVLQPLIPEYKEILETIVQDFKIKKEYKLQHDNSWVNINQPKDYNLDHSHRGALISSVFYVKSKDENAKLVFNMTSGHEKEWYFRDYIEEGDTYTSPKVAYDPIEGRAIFFPSYLIHHVLPSTEERISIASNFIII